MSHIFISYARKDIDFAGNIVQALAENNLDTWIDWKNIPGGEDWKQEIFRGIEEADAFLFLISPDSVASQMCNEEIAHAVKNGKRILPIFISNADVGETNNTFREEKSKGEISRRNYIFCRDGQDDFNKAIKKIHKTIHTDYEWLKYQTELQVKALKWEQRKDNSRLLRGKELQEAEKQLSTVGQKDPLPTDLQRQYALESRGRESRTRNSIFAIGAMVIVALAFLSLFAFNQKNIANDNAVTAVANQHVAQTAQANAEEQARITLARQLAAQAINLESDQYDLSLLLAVQAYRINPTYVAQAALLDVLEYNPHLQIFLKKNFYGPNMRIAVSSDGKLLASSACTNATVQCQKTEIDIWNLTTGKLADGPFFVDRRAELIAFSPDDKNLAFIVNDSGGDYVMLWSLSKGESVKKFEHNASGLAFTPDGKTLATVGFDNKIVLWSVETGQRIGEPLIGHQSFVISVAIDSTGTLLATGGADGMILFWDVPSRKVIGSPIYPGVNPIQHLSFSPNSQQLVVLSGTTHTTYESGDLTLWDVNTRSLQYKQSSIAMGSHSTAFNPQGTVLAYANRNNIILLDLANLKSQTILEGQLSTTIIDLAFSPDGNTLASISTLGDLILWNLNSDHRLQHLIENNTGDWVQMIKFIPATQSFAATRLNNSTVNLWDITSGRQIGELVSEASGGVRSLAISPDGEFLATGGDNQTIQLWNVTQKSLWGLPLSGHTSLISGLAISSDGKYLISSALGDETIRLWNIQEHKLVTTFSANDFAKNNIAKIAFNPNGKSFATCGVANKIVVWDMATKVKQMIPFTNSPSGSCFALEYSPDGSMIALNDSSSGNAIVIKTSTAEIVAELNLKHSSGIASGIAFSPDGARLAVAFCLDIEFECQNNTVALWDVSNFQSLGQFPMDFLQSTNTLDFSSDNKILVTGGKSGQIIALDVNVKSWLYRACQIANRNLSISEWKQYVGSASPYMLTCPKLPAGEGVSANIATNLNTFDGDESPPSLFQLPPFSSPETTAQNEQIIGQNNTVTPPGGWQVEAGKLPDSLKFKFPAIIQCRASADSDNYVQSFFGIWGLQNTQTDRWISKGKAHVTMLDALGNEITSYPLGFASGNNTTSWLMPDDNVKNMPLMNNVSPGTILRLDIDTVEWQKTSDQVGDYKSDISVESQSLYGNPQYPQHIVVFSVNNPSKYVMANVSIFAVVQNAEGETVDLLRSSDGTDADITDGSTDLASNEGGYFIAKSISQSGRCVGKSSEKGNTLLYWVSFSTEDGKQLAEFYNTINLR